MSLIAIWVDQEHAKVFNYTSSGLKSEEFKAHHVDHHSHAHDNTEHQRIEKGLFKQFTPTLNTAEQILILGPGKAKNHLKNFLVESGHGFDKKIVGCEAMDHPTDAQIVEYARKFFNTEHLS